jgi:hypothetical protein
MRTRVASVTLTAALFAALFFSLSGVARAQDDLQPLHSFGADGVAPHGLLFQAISSPSGSQRRANSSPAFPFP